MQTNTSVNYSRSPGKIDFWSRTGLALISHRLAHSVFAAFFVIAAVLPTQAAQFEDFTYNSTGSGIIITGYTGAGGAVTIPSTIAALPVITIGTSAFKDKALMTSVIIPNSVINIVSYAFQNCNGLTSVIVPNRVNNIENYAFTGCRNLTSVTIGSGVTTIGGAVFQSCTKLASVTILNGVTSIGTSMFNGCSKLASVTIPNSVTSIGSYAFFGTGLTSVTIPNGEIKSEAFSSCVGLITVTIGSSVTSIGNSAFQYCYDLNSIYFEGNAPTATATSLADTYPTVYYYAGKTGWGSTYAGRPTVQLGASITSQPINLTALQGKSASFTVTANGATGYQWQKNTVDIPLANTATLSLANLQASDSASYTVVVFNPAGNLTSNAAVLTVLLDSDRDGLTDVEEAIYGTNPNHPDSDDDGLSDRTEIQVYLSNPLIKDTDSDGFEDGFEVSTGFNPTLVNSSPDSVSTINNAVGFRFNAGLGLSYRIEDSVDLENWNTIESQIIGDGGVVTRFYFTTGYPKRYFRARKN